MTPQHDLRPTAERLGTLLDGVREDQFGLPTPCAEFTVRDLLGHLHGLTLAFHGAARKSPDPGPPPANPGELLTDDWRDRIAAQATELASAWRDPAAWDGATSVGGVELPAALTGVIGLNELLLHSWDLAKATGQPYDPDPGGVAASLEFTTLVNSPAWTVGRAGLFDEVVPVPEDAPPMDRTLGLSGRDPNWTPPR